MPLLVAFLLAGCHREDGDPVPPSDIVDMVEAKLAGHSCVGDLEGWERNYRFAKPTGFSAYTSQADLGIVEFHLRRAGATTIAPGRNTFGRHGDDWPESKAIRAIDGRFRLSDGRLSMPACR